MEVKPVLSNYNTYCGYGVEFENYSKHECIMISRAYFLHNNKKIIIVLTSDKPLYVLRWLLGFPAKFHILRCSHSTCCCRFWWK